ncbi:hypothetical protein MMC06_005320 [Schaereria dolodes]|nr:hypothetical protein [Schaereria dolodes]
MARLPDWQPRKTVIDLYNDRDSVRWYWRLLGTISAATILVGFLIFPSAFESSTTTRASQGTLSVVSVVLLALGYSLSVALWFLCTSLLFQLDVLFIPCLFSCLLGLLNVIISIAIYPSNSQWNPSSISALTLALASSLIYGVLSLLTFHKISKLRTRDALTRRRTDSEAARLIPEDELQRQQLQRLLGKNNDDKTSPAASQNTFQIHIPEPSKPQRDSRRAQDSATTPYLTAPSNIYEGRSRSVGAIPLDQAPSLAREQKNSQESGVDPKLVNLERARQRSQNMRDRGYSNPRYPNQDLPQSPQGPPVIINTRAVPLVGDNIPLSERHPLERGDYIRGVKQGEPVASEGVYRPEDHDPETEYQEDLDYQASMGLVGGDYDLGEERGRKRDTVKELQGVDVTPRIVRVQTDGWGR